MVLVTMLVVGGTAGVRRMSDCSSKHAYLIDEQAMSVLCHCMDRNYLPGGVVGGVLVGLGALLSAGVAVGTGGPLVGVGI